MSRRRVRLWAPLLLTPLVILGWYHSIDQDEYLVFPGRHLMFHNQDGSLSCILHHGRGYSLLAPGFHSFGRPDGGISFIDLIWNDYSAGVAVGYDFLLFLLFMPIATSYLIGWKRRRKSSVRRFEGFCAQCGYNLTGNESGRCPECGTVCESDDSANQELLAE